MLQRLKVNSAKKKLRHNRDGERSISLKEIRKVAVVLDAEAFAEGLNLNEFKKAFQDLGASVEFIIFSENKLAEEEVFSKKDLAWKGKFKPGSAAEKFINNEVNVLINYFTSEKSELQILSQLKPAKLKVGFPLKNQYINDVEINIDVKKVKLFVSETNKYLNILKQ